MLHHYLNRLQASNSLYFYRLSIYLKEAILRIFSWFTRCKGAILRVFNLFLFITNEQLLVSCTHLYLSQKSNPTHPSLLSKKLGGDVTVNRRCKMV